jgi:putative tryptophan/tyrosine transport system substrate-binding protein
VRRRDFIALFSGAAAVWPIAAPAQHTGKLPVIGVLQHNASGFSPWGAAFETRLRELNWIEGRTVAIEYRWSEGRPERVAEIAAEFVQQEVGVIVAYGAAAIAVKKATTSIPIVFAPANDPVGVGLVANLSHPGGNVTGISLQQAESAGKRFDLLRRVVPNLRRLGILFDSGYSATVREMEEVQAVARNLGIEVEPRGIQQTDEIAPVIDDFKGHVDALYVVQNALIDANRALVIRDTLTAKIPTSFVSRELVQEGALMSYGPNLPGMFARVAEIVDRILRGTNPGEIPVEQPTKFDLVINLKTAKALGIDVPNSVQLLADEIIE